MLASSPNHLSLTLVTALEEHLPQYLGAVVVASHDRWLRRSWTGQRRQLNLEHSDSKPVPLFTHPAPGTALGIVAVYISDTPVDRMRWRLREQAEVNVSTTGT